MQVNYTVVIILSLVGFLILAAVLLVPVWRFLSREEREADEWTRSRVSDPEPGEPAERTNGDG